MLMIHRVSKLLFILLMITTQRALAEKPTDGAGCFRCQEYNVQINRIKNLPKDAKDVGQILRQFELTANLVNKMPAKPDHLLNSPQIEDLAELLIEAHKADQRNTKEQFQIIIEKSHKVIHANREQLSDQIRTRNYPNADILFSIIDIKLRENGHKAPQTAPTSGQDNGTTHPNMAPATARASS